jgi:hypothetical protein
MNTPPKYLVAVLEVGLVVAGVFSFGGTALADSDFATTSAWAMHRGDFRSATSTHNPAGIMRGWAKNDKESPRGFGQNQFMNGNGQPIIGGTVEAISGNTLTVTNKSNATYSVDTVNAIIRKGMATSTLANISVGDSVVVQGVVNGTTVTASSVIDQGTFNPRDESATTTPKHQGGGFFNMIGGFFSRLFGFF